MTTSTTTSPSEHRHRWWETSTPSGSGELAPSPAGPVDELGTPPPLHGSGPLLQTLRLGRDQGRVLFEGTRLHGDVFRVNTLLEKRPLTITSHPDHVKSLFTAGPALAPSTAGQSQLRPIVGESVLTATGERHRRQRKLLMPPFHGKAIARYREQILDATTREINGWQPGSRIRLADSAQQVTLDVIMSGVFGIDYRSGESEQLLRKRLRQMLALSVSPLARVSELVSMRSAEPVGVQKWGLAHLDRAMLAVIAERRAAHVPGERHDILSLLLDARDDEGAGLTDGELRNELLTLVLAGHETTANSIGWAFERLVRHPEFYGRLRDAARSEDDGGYVDATIHEAMRVRPVIPMLGRRVMSHWRFGDRVVPERSRVLIGILSLHHREDLYADPFRFDPDRFVGVKPGSTTWIPFGGGDRRCLGATLAMEEMRLLTGEIARRADLSAIDSAPERPVHRNVTMIPGRGGAVEIGSVMP
ncbi:cytochrome P450 [Saccharopolyspora karakumensis]|uniref:Cytochrome P450 n=1 Tax=Saccharopolyspora karakumensis TaxID=2530386 RepID=A0A4R5BZL1_9PSEU|nr:cytochrome P450 [Saccharopolyspora karakumensis]TDD90920.1 cytochrome P450 [Saccharopolyspora karakumensis]